MSLVFENCSHMPSYDFCLFDLPVVSFAFHRGELKIEACSSIWAVFRIQIKCAVEQVAHVFLFLAFLVVLGFYSFFRLWAFWAGSNSTLLILNF